jgi:tRNA-specific 2-thiouridylase
MTGAGAVGVSTVLVAMSGGVDSSVAAALLLEEGHEVVGVTMKLWGGDSDTGCCSVSDVDDARRVAHQLGISHHVFNFTEGFQREVVDPYVRAHAEGRTPNPCIECNRHLKFDRLLERATRLGIDQVATGHHARVVEGHVARGADRAKDQSYVVHMLRGDALARVRFPVGSITKDEVRAHAARLGLRTAGKPDSQDVCFITRSGRATFLSERIPLHEGRVVDAGGVVVGAVPAVELVTVGQRRGLGLPGGHAQHHAVAVDVPGRTVTVGPVEALLRESLQIERVVWAGEPFAGDVLAQCSAHGAVRRAAVEPSADGAVLRWATLQPAVAPGQSVVLYDLADERVLAGGLAT